MRFRVLVMLNRDIQTRILSSLQGAVLSTSMVSRKAGFSRITTAKYLHALAGKNAVQAVRVGKAVAWRVTEHKPSIAIIAKTGVARIVKLCLGEKYAYTLATTPSAVRDAFVVITDDKRLVKNATIPVILIGSYDADAWSLPELFDSLTLKSLVKKIHQEQHMPSTQAVATITIENLEELEESLGIDASDDLLKLFSRVLTENRLRFKQYARSTFLLEQPMGDQLLADIEQTFQLILCHIYGRLVTPGEEVDEDGDEHTVPSLSIAVDTLVDGVKH